jgi:hypothetical protein
MMGRLAQFFSHFFVGCFESSRQTSFVKYNIGLCCFQSSRLKNWAINALRLQICKERAQRASTFSKPQAS